MSDLIAQMLAGVPDFEGALCAEVDPEIFFPEGQGSPARTAKAICQNCVAVVECLDYALANDIPNGVWGGLAPRERRVIRQAMKAEAANESKES